MANETEQIALSVRLPEPTWRKLKILAMDRKTSIKSIITEAVSLYLKGAK